MKYLDFYKERGLESKEDVFEFFIENLQETIVTWDYFTDWDKVRKKVEDLEEELRLLNTLLGKKDTEEKLIDLLKRHPRIKKGLSLLIAVRANKLRKTHIVSLEDIDKSIDDWTTELKRKYFKVNKEINNKTKEELINFYVNSGLKNVFENKDIKDLVDYYFGVEVGMDTNARKNRTGFAMEKIVYRMLDKDFNNLIEQATQQKIKEKWDKDVQIKKNESGRDNKVDFAILENDKIYLIETNYYNTTGSKPSEIVGGYSDEEKHAKKNDLEFIWITDGVGWRGMKNSIRDAIYQNDYVFNLKMVSEGILNEVIKNE
ncbi:MAG: DpnII family type II restriction endonuclease [Candidatus Magasanikbacteria bacterium]